MKKWIGLVFVLLLSVNLLISLRRGHVEKPIQGTSREEESGLDRQLIEEPAPFGKGTIIQEQSNELAPQDQFATIEATDGPCPESSLRIIMSNFGKTWGMQEKGNLFIDTSDMKRSALDYYTCKALVQSTPDPCLEPEKLTPAGKLLSKNCVEDFRTITGSPPANCYSLHGPVCSAISGKSAANCIQFQNGIKASYCSLLKARIFQKSDRYRKEQATREQANQRVNAILRRLKEKRPQKEGD